MFERVAELERTRTPFALATVVARQAPISAHVGDRAVVLADGRMQGFVGGSCARDIVRRQAVSAMRSGTARLVQIRPNAPPNADDASPVGTVVVPLTCASEGALDVYVEPHLPPRILLVAGATPVAHSLAQLGALLDGYRVVHFEEADELPALREFLAGLDPGARDGLAAVVATQGHYDEPVLEALLAEEVPPYVGLLASRKRAAEVFEIVVRHGIARDRIEQRAQSGRNRYWCAPPERRCDFDSGRDRRDRVGERAEGGAAGIVGARAERRSRLRDGR